MIPDTMPTPLLTTLRVRIPETRVSSGEGRVISFHPMYALLVAVGFRPPEFTLPVVSGVLLTLPWNPLPRKSQPPFQPLANVICNPLITGCPLLEMDQPENNQIEHVDGINLEPTSRHPGLARPF